MASTSSSSSSSFSASSSPNTPSSLALSLAPSLAPAHRSRLSRPSLKLSPFCARGFWEIQSPIRASTISTSATLGASAEILPREVDFDSPLSHSEIDETEESIDPPAHPSRTSLDPTTTMASLTATATTTTTTPPYPTAPYTPSKSKPTSSHPSSSSKLQDSPFSDYFTDDNISLPPHSSPFDNTTAAANVAVITPEKKQLLLRMGRLQDLLVRGGGGADNDDDGGEGEREMVRIVERKIGEMETLLAGVHAQTRVAAEMEDSGLFLEEDDEDEPVSNDDLLQDVEDAPATLPAAAAADETSPENKAQQHQQPQDINSTAQQTLTLLTRTTSHLRTQHSALRTLHDTHLSQLDALRAENAALRSRLHEMRRVFRGMEREVCAVEDAAERLVGYQPALAGEIGRVRGVRLRGLVEGWRGWDFSLQEGESFEVGLGGEEMGVLEGKDGGNTEFLEKWMDGGLGSGEKDVGFGDEILNGDADVDNDDDENDGNEDPPEILAEEPREIELEIFPAEEPSTSDPSPAPAAAVLFPSSSSASSDNDNEEDEEGDANETDSDDHDPLRDEEDLGIDCAITTSSEDNNLPVPVPVPIAVADSGTDEELHANGEEPPQTKSAWQELWDGLASLAGMGEEEAEF